MLAASNSLAQDTTEKPITEGEDIFADPYAFKDTVHVVKFSYMDIFYRESLDDSTYHISDIWYDPTQSENFLYADLGHLGSASMKDYFQPGKSIGIRYDYHQYDLYKKSAHTPEYRINTAFTDLGFSQGLSQNQQYIEADFAARYRNGTLSLSYDRINDGGAYLSQLNIHTAIYGKLSLELKPVLLQFQFNSNIIQARDNGGFVSDTLFPPPFTTFSSVAPVYLNETAQTRQHEKFYIIRDYWPIIGSLSDTSFLVLRHQISYINEYVRFYDTSPNKEYYSPLIYDSRGIRYFIKDNHLRNTFHILWRTRQLSWLKGQINAGIIHEWHFIEEYMHRRQAQWLAIDADLQTEIGSFMRLESSLTQSFIPDISDTRFLNHLSIGWRKYFDIHAYLNFIRRRPSINAMQFYINGKALWDNELKAESTLQFGGALDITPLHSRIGLEYNHISNLIYYTPDLQRMQADNGIDLLRTYLSTRLVFGIFHLDSETSLQISENSLLPYSRLVSDLRAYVQFHLFDGKMLITTGPYGKYYTQPHGYTYLPALGQFALSDRHVRSSAYHLNYVLAFRVLSMTLYAHMTGIQSLWNKYAFYEIQDYAHPVIGFRFGISWQLYN